MKIKLFAATLATLLALTACGGGDASQAPTVTVTVTETVTAEPGPVEGEPDSAESADDTSGSGVAAFGESVKLPNDEGTISISKPEPYEPSDTAAVTGEWDEFVVMTVVETNDGSEPTSAGWAITATSGSVEAGRVFDSEKGVDSPTANVMPGKSIEYKIAFGRMAGADFVVTASPLAGLSSAYFQ